MKCVAAAAATYMLSLSHSALSIYTAIRDVNAGSSLMIALTYDLHIICTCKVTFHLL